MRNKSVALDQNLRSKLLESALLGAGAKRRVVVRQNETEQALGNRLNLSNRRDRSAFFATNQSDIDLESNQDQRGKCALLLTYSSLTCRISNRCKFWTCVAGRS